MNTLHIAVTLGLLGAVLAQLGPIESRPSCDSLEAEAAALVAQDYLNAQHTHGYKYVLNRVEDIKIIATPSGDEIYFLELDLLETKCHVLDPTPLANCTVRPKILTAVEGDCDIVMKKVGGVLTVTAFKCKTEESTEDLCVGCPILLPLNDTTALDFVLASLVTLNERTINTTFSLLEVGRMSSKIVSGGHIYEAEYVIVEANCTANFCVPLSDANLEVNGTAASSPTMVQLVHTHAGNLTARHGLRHHKLTSHHDPELSGLLSAESAESDEVVQVVSLPLTPLAPVGVVPVRTVPVGTVPVETVPVGAVPVGTVPVGTVPVETVPVGTVPVETVPVGTVPVGTVPVGTVPVGTVPIPAADSTPGTNSSSASNDAPASNDTPAVVVKREAPATDVAGMPAMPVPLLQAEPLFVVPLCPGKIRYF